MNGIQLIVGLGNPGPQYEATRHNAGFWFVDRVADAHRVSMHVERKFHGYVGRATIDGHEVWLLKPQTYMNRSGLAVVSLAAYYKILPDRILVAYDELDLPAGTVKLKQGGSAGTHNGIRDIVAHLSTGAFWRLRFGIGHPGDKNLVLDYVLQNPSKVDRANIDEATDRSLGVLHHLLAGEAEAAMLKLHTKPKPPAAAPAAQSKDSKEP